MKTRYDKRDHNELEIIEALKSIGCSVTRITSIQDPGVPDLLVGYRHRTYLLEVKQTGKTSSPVQTEWYATWFGGPPKIVHTGQEAIDAIQDFDRHITEDGLQQWIDEAKGKRKMKPFGNWISQRQRR